VLAQNSPRISTLCLVETVTASQSRRPLLDSKSRLKRQDPEIAPGLENEP